MIDFVTPSGYLTFSLFSYLPVVLGIYTILAGSGLIAADEEKGTLDLTLAYPISRSVFFFSRLAGVCPDHAGDPGAHLVGIRVHAAVFKTGGEHG